ncbi:MAG TPA: uracil-DNA glycosylase [Elusimicrobiota bacterium]|nr:uracil-DNA glycosylase [Elusimicrobiota bacterium]
MAQPKNAARELLDLTRELRARLEIPGEAEASFGRIPASKAESAQATAAVEVSATVNSKMSVPHKALMTDSVQNAAGKHAALDALAAEIKACRRCPLGKSRIQAVPGVGSPEARVVFIGEGPGYQEDRKGEPFVGPAGKLLDKILASIGLSRETVYIANVVKCHPMKDPTNPDLRGNDRPPTPEETETCLPFLQRQLRVISPDIIVALGASALRVLAPQSEGLSRVRGTWMSYSLPDGKTFKLLPTYHPAALLRNPNWKKDVWTDMKALRQELLGAGGA